MSFINLSNKPNPTLPRGQLRNVTDLCGTDAWNRLPRVLSQAGGEGKISNVIPGADHKAHPWDPLKVPFRVPLLEAGTQKPLKVYLKSVCPYDLWKACLPPTPSLPMCGGFSD